MNKYMKFFGIKQLALTLFFFASITYGQSVVSGTSLVLDSLASNPAAPNSGYQTKIFVKRGADGLIHLYRLWRGTVKMIDSNYTSNTRQDTVFYRIGMVSRGTITTTDSLREVVIPVGSTWRIDSLKQWASNPSSLTYKLYKNVAGSVSQITNGNVSITSSTTSTGGLQNNTSLTGNTELWVAITGGTADRARIEIIFKNQ